MTLYLGVKIKLPSEARHCPSLLFLPTLSPSSAQWLCWHLSHFLNTLHTSFQLSQPQATYLCRLWSALPGAIDRVASESQAYAQGLLEDAQVWNSGEALRFTSAEPGRCGEVNSSGMVNKEKQINKYSVLGWRAVEPRGENGSLSGCFRGKGRLGRDSTEEIIWN